MSKFKTSFPFDLEETKKRLPPGAFFAGAVWNKDANALEILWEHDGFQSGLDFPKEFTPRDLSAKELPKGVTIRERDKIPTTVIVAKPEGAVPEGMKRVAYTAGPSRSVKVDYQPEVTQAQIGLKDVPADLPVTTFNSLADLDKAVADHLQAKADAAKAQADAEAKAAADAAQADADLKAQADAELKAEEEAKAKAAAEAQAATEAAVKAEEEAAAKAAAKDAAKSVMTPAAKTVAQKGKGK